MAPTVPSAAKSASPSQPSGKSEVADLKQQLRQLAGSRAPDADDQRRDVFKRVISCMTAGIDVSAAFGEMVLCSATSDVVTKKMCYLYVGSHARAHPDLALLTINFLQRDCRDQDPTIRGLALRSLCSLRVPNLVEYLVTPLTTGLKDPSAYVRTIAAVGAAKLYHISATACIDADLPASLKALMLSDPDAQVKYPGTNCLVKLCSNLTELCEYAGNVDVPIARESIRAVGKIALQQYDVNAIVDRLLQFLEMDKDYVTAETLVLVKDLLRKYPQWSHDCIAVVGNISSKNIQEPKGKAALIWMLGEYSQDMHDAPYILESLVENWDEEHSPEVRLHLLTAVMKCFFKRPPETQKALGDTLAAGLSDTHQDVHDRALFYYRLLQYSPNVAERVVNPPKQAVSVFADTQSSEIKDRIFDEFNSLSVVYQKPSYMFTDKEHRGPFEYSEDLTGLTEDPENVISAQRYQENDNDLLLSTSDKEDNGTRASNGSSTSTYNAPSDLISPSLISSQAPAETSLVNTGGTYSSQSNFSLDDLLGLSVTEAPALPQPTLALNSKPVLDPGTFQRKWGQLALALSQECSLSPQGAVALMNPQSLIRHMQSNHIQCIASGGQPPNYKFFFYAQKDGAAAFFLVECIVNTASAKAQLKIKADDGTAAEAFSSLFQSALSKFGLS
ncbi:Adaptin region family protein [Zea mays]|uniref:Beta-adaptin-like protein n=1 Tax=Zea mays TaxID=4577 RepID=A0A1D6FZU8_MAIZE|nr:Adaptin region family protein [Zea mays]